MCGWQRPTRTKSASFVGVANVSLPFIRAIPDEVGCPEEYWECMIAPAIVENHRQLFGGNKRAKLLEGGAGNTLFR